MDLKSNKLLVNKTFDKRSLTKMQFVKKITVHEQEAGQILYMLFLEKLRSKCQPIRENRYQETYKFNDL